MSYSLNPVTRARLARSSFAVARGFGRRRVAAAALALCMLVAGRTPKYRIRAF